MNERRIIQILPTLSYGDAVSNDALALKKIIEKAGYISEIMAIYVSPELKKQCKIIDNGNIQLSSEDVLIYHFAISSPLSSVFINARCHKIIIYHNVTPPRFFASFQDFLTADYCATGLMEIEEILPYAELCIADSTENKESLIGFGAKCRIETLPIIIPFEDYLQEPDVDTLQALSDGRTNVLFVGRVAPNKCHQDIISSFYYYNQIYDNESRLFLVGRYNESDNYFKKLREYISRLKAKNIYFIQHISFSKLLAYYSAADVFLLESEHEGFCVPLVEAMFFGIPIIAYDATAVSETLGNSGILLKEKDPVITAGIIDRIVSDQKLRDLLIKEEREQLDKFEYEKTKNRFISILNDFFSEN